ncbi:MAG: NAD(P)-dependent oxidoreductase [Novosphingobium sp.]|jgi:3-hydroxyisobutyrate dehydrogenase-like beta-hydroxyacid dehydrogenase|nr:NAD(P)-dependent oxidoreductase [Novosphingobium sp.]
MKVGFIGLGSIGSFMARRLARVGFAVTGCDISAEMLAAFDEPGTRREADPIATAGGADILGICVRTDEQLASLAGDGALFAALGNGGIAVIHSTVAPELARSLAETAAAHGVGLIDAGVSPGGPHVGEGRASIFTGGADRDVARARPYLEALGRVAHLGPVGRGLEAKLLNNLASTAGYGLSVSILALGRRLGFDEEVLRQALLAGSAQSFALQVAPGLLRPGGPGATGTRESLHDLLRKDVDHAAALVADPGDPALRVLLDASRAMFDALRGGS